MGSLIRLILLGLVGAVIVHICVLFLVPVYSNTNAWARIENATSPYRFVALDEKKGPVR
jgi:uncharacterized membrane protein